VRREGRGSTNPRASETSKDLLMSQQFAPYAWTAVPPVSPLPYMPFYHLNVDNTPLLPPVPPFMMQQHRRSFNTPPSQHPLPANYSTERLPPSDSLKRQPAHERHSSGAIQWNKRVSTASRTPSSPAILSGSKDRVSQSRSTPSPSPIRPSSFVPPRTRPTLALTNRRQTVT